MIVGPYHTLDVILVGAVAVALVVALVVARRRDRAEWDRCFRAWLRGER